MTSKTELQEGDTVVLTRAVDMAGGTIPFRSMLIVAGVMKTGGVVTHCNLERADGSIAISCAPVEMVRK